MANAGPDYPSEKTFTLRTPMKFGGKEFSEITLSEPTAGQLKQVEKLSGYAFSIKLVSVNSGKLESEIETMGQRDLNDCMEYLTGFYQPDPKPGEPSSAA